MRAPALCSTGWSGAGSGVDARSGPDRATHTPREGFGEEGGKRCEILKWWSWGGGTCFFLFKSLQPSGDGTYWTIVTAQGDGVMKVLQNGNTSYSGDKICHVCVMGVEGWAKASKRRLLKEEKELDRRTLLARRCCFRGQRG